MSQTPARSWPRVKGCDVEALVVDKVRKTFEAENAPVRALRGADRFVDELSQHGILLVSDQPLMDSFSSQESR